MPSSNLISAIQRFTSLRALVVGDVMLDVYEFCLTSESRELASEKAGKRAYKSQKAVRVLGGAGNVAVNLASLGVQTSMVGLAGNDESYYVLRELAEKSGIAQFLVRDASRPTTVKSRLYIDEEYLLRRDSESAEKVDKAVSATLVQEVFQLIPKVDVVVLSDYNKGVFAPWNASDIIRECKRHNLPVVVDFKPVNKALFAGADIIAPNENEARELLPSFSRDRLEESTRKVFDMLGCGAVVITLGENGLSGFDKNGFFHVPGITVKANDAVGCGDTVRTGLALGLAAGLTVKESAMLANFAAAVIVQKPLTSSLTSAELTAFIRSRA